MNIMQSRIYINPQNGNLDLTNFRNFRIVQLCIYTENTYKLNSGETNFTVENNDKEQAINYTEPQSSLFSGAYK